MRRRLYKNSKVDGDVRWSEGARYSWYEYKKCGISFSSDKYESTQEKRDPYIIIIIILQMINS